MPRCQGKRLVVCISRLHPESSASLQAPAAQPRQPAVPAVRVLRELVPGVAPGEALLSVPISSHSPMPVACPQALHAWPPAKLAHCARCLQSWLTEPVLEHDMRTLVSLQDENRHGDFFTAILKARSEFVSSNDWQVGFLKPFR